MRSTMSQPWVESIASLLDAHDVREPVERVLLWHKKRWTGSVFAAGLVTYVLNQFIGVGFLTVVGIVLMLQLLVFRAARFMQTREFRLPGSYNPFIKSDVDLTQSILLTPTAATVSTTIELVGDVCRHVEESLKELSLGNDYMKLFRGLGVLVFFSAAGTVVAFPDILLGVWVVAFTVPIAYSRNQDAIDERLNKVSKAVSKASRSKKKHKSKSRASHSNEDKEE